MLCSYIIYVYVYMLLLQISYTISHHKQYIIICTSYIVIYFSYYINLSCYKKEVLHIFK